MFDFDNDQINIGCDTCEHSQYNGSDLNGPFCDVGLRYEEGCPRYRMTFNYFCQNHGLYDRNTGHLKKINGNLTSVFFI